MANCGCDWTGDDWPADFWSSRTVKARVAHRCSECDRTIQPGEHYDRWCMKWEGHIDYGATCSDCVRVSSAHNHAMRSVPKDSAYHGERGYVLGELRCAVACMVSDSPEYLAAFRAKWREMKGAGHAA